MTNQHLDPAGSTLADTTGVGHGPPGSRAPRSRTRRRPAALILAALVASGLAVTTSSTAASGQSAVVGAASIHDPAAASPQEYWTTARMAAAKPVAVSAPGGLALAPAESATTSATGSATPVRLAEPYLAPEVSAARSRSNVAFDGVVEGVASPVANPYDELPDRLNGKIFFSSYDQSGRKRGDFVCSGTVVNSPNESVIWTAAHCVHGGKGFQFHRNWVFVPGYSSRSAGDRPFGTWAARFQAVPNDWVQNGQSLDFATSRFRNDIGAVVVDRLNRRTIVDRLQAAHGLVVNANPRTTYLAFGYPSGAPFDGTWQYVVVSRFKGRNNTIPGPGPAPIKILSNMTPGSSGGGWIIEADDTGLGLVASVNSFKNNALPQFMNGPYLGAGARSLYNFVKSR